MEKLFRTDYLKMVAQCEDFEPMQWLSASEIQLIIRELLVYRAEKEKGLCRVRMKAITPESDVRFRG